MLFSLTVEGNSGELVTLEVSVGQTVFVLGANGTGKSSLLQRFASTMGENSRRISASRQTWFGSSTLEFTPSQKQSYEQQARNWDREVSSRWREQNPHIRSSLTLYDLIDAENIEARAIASAMRSGDLSLAQALAQKTAPIEKINELLALSNINIQISVAGGDQLLASKNGCHPYGAAELSDGERNALLIAADVLTAKAGALLIIDEPERHLHRSIISPLLNQLFRYRDDCAFIVGTHDLMLPVDNPESRIFLVRGCRYSGNYPTSWDVDILPSDFELDDAIKQDIVGARRKIVFVEGQQSSLDHPLYSVLFPGVSVRPKGSSRDVEQAVLGVRGAEALHWVQAWGIIDNDGRSAKEVEDLGSIGIFALPFYSVESVYYHPDLISAVAIRQARVTGGDGDGAAKMAIQKAIATAQTQFPRLAARAVEKSIRRNVLSSMPTIRQIENKESVNLQIDTSVAIEQEIEALTAAADANDWVPILTRCPIRETQALGQIANAVGLTNRHQYEAAVLQVLREDATVLAKVRGMFGRLSEELTT